MQLNYQKNLTGNFNFLSLLFLFFFSCHQQEKENVKLFEDNIESILNNKDSSELVFINKKVGEYNYIIENCNSIVEIDGFNLIKNCKKHYFSLVNNEGFNIDDSTEYMSCDLSNLKLSRVKVIDNKYQPTFHKYKRIGIFNYLIQNDKAFFILKKDSINGSLKEYMVEIYFFNKINNNWIFYKKILLSNT